MKNFQNIPESNIVSVDETTETKKAYLKIRTSATFSLPMFSIMQFIAGVQFLEAFKSMSKEYIEKRYVDLIARLFEVALGQQEGIGMVLVREEVKLLRELLEARMKHCEKERDERTPGVHSDGLKFNPDTYIAQKILLLDLREWLLGEEVNSMYETGKYPHEQPNEA